MVHGIENDWIEDEMADDDEDFINIVLELDFNDGHFFVTMEW